MLGLLPLLLVSVLGARTALETAIFEEHDIEKGISILPETSSDYALKYFVLRRFTPRRHEAFQNLLSADLNNSVIKALVTRAFSSDSLELRILPALHLKLNIEASEGVARKYFENPYDFYEYELLSAVPNYHVKDVLTTVWSMDSTVMDRFLYFVGSRMIKIADVIPILEFLCSKQVPWAFGLLGDAYFYGLGVEKDLDKALEYYWAGRDMGNAKCYVGIGRVLMDDQYADYSGAEAAFDAANSSEFSPEAIYCKYLISKKTEGSSPDNKVPSILKNPLMLLQPAVIRGYLPAVFHYTLEQINAAGVSSESKIASYIYSLMSVSWYSPFLLDLDTRARERYMAADYKSAALYYLYLASFNNDVALKNAVYILERHKVFEHTGQGKSPSGLLYTQDEILFSLYKELSEKNAFYYLRLGDCFFYGKGVPEVSMEKAFAHYLAASEVSGEAAYNVAYMYETGKGTKQDLSLAYEYVNSRLRRKKHYLLTFYLKIRLLTKLILTRFKALLIAVVFGTAGCFIVLSRRLNKPESS